MTDTTLSTKDKSKTVTNPQVDNAAREKLITARVGLLLRAEAGQCRRLVSYCRNRRP